MEPSVAGLTLDPVESDADLKALIAVRVVGEPDRPPPHIDNLRQNLAREGLAYVLARIDGGPVGYGFVHPWPPEHADAQLLVLPETRGRGIGSALLAHVGVCARAAKKEQLQGEVRESDRESREFFERRGYRIVGGEQAVVLDLSAARAPASAPPPPGVRIVSRRERPDLVEALFPIGLEASEDIPGSQGALTFELWRWLEIDRPSRDPSLFFVALAGDEPVGYAAIETLAGGDAYHGLTAVKRSWRRRGVATALKQAQIAALKQRGFRRLVTSNEERNASIRELNEKLGYGPEPALSSVVIQGPLPG